MHCLSQISLDAELLAVGGKRTEQDQQVTDRSRAVSIEVRWTRVRCGQFTGTVINEGIHVVIRCRFVCTTEAIISAVSIVEQRRCEVVAGCSIGTTERRAVLSFFFSNLYPFGACSGKFRLDVGRPASMAAESYASAASLGVSNTVRK